VGRSSVVLDPAHAGAYDPAAGPEALPHLPAGSPSDGPASRPWPPVCRRS